jgi:hypothetical protein
MTTVAARASVSANLSAQNNPKKATAHCLAIEGPVMGYVSTLMRIQSALQKAGIRFLDNGPGGGIGVRLIKPNA